MIPNEKEVDLINNLLRKWLDEEISEVELIILNNWADASPKNREVMLNLKENKWLAEQLWKLDHVDTTRLWKKSQELMNND